MRVKRAADEVLKKYQKAIRRYSRYQQEIKREREKY